MSNPPQWIMIPDLSDYPKKVTKRITETLNNNINKETYNGCYIHSFRDIESRLEFYTLLIREDCCVKRYDFSFEQYICGGDNTKYINSEEYETTRENWDFTAPALE